ncbi:hypothetical protein [Parasitella parasitica]|uniref:Uncharacterized protein n=1 Tax=Parasitella parasitica TaxID=35722 RepID=A0A0B7NPP2_9FUNG|nr:hypothetical protein [Parasitella parasitica]
MEPKVNGYSQCITAACFGLATTYTNSIVECFESSLKSHLLNESNRNFLKKTVHMYCYQRIYGGTPEWPDNLSEIYNDKKSEIDDIYKDLETINMPRPVTLQSLSRNPAAIPAEPKQDKNLPRLFSLAPVPSLKWRFITIIPNILAAFAGSRKKTKFAFSNVIRTDGFSADVVLLKTANTNETKHSRAGQDINIELLVSVMTEKEFKDALDPYRGQMFAATYGDGGNSHQCSAKEYYTSSTAKNRLQLYQGVERAREEMANILMNGGSQKEKI